MEPLRCRSRNWLFLCHCFHHRYIIPHVLTSNHLLTCVCTSNEAVFFAGLEVLKCVHRFLLLFCRTDTCQLTLWKQKIMRFKTCNADLLSSILLWFLKAEHKDRLKDKFEREILCLKRLRSLSWQSKGNKYLWYGVGKYNALINVGGNALSWKTERKFQGIHYHPSLRLTLEEEGQGKGVLPNCTTSFQQRNCS